MQKIYTLIIAVEHYVHEQHFEIECFNSYSTPPTHCNPSPLIRQNILLESEPCEASFVWQWIRINRATNYNFKTKRIEKKAQIDSHYIL